MKKQVLIMDPRDNVGIAVREIGQGESVHGGEDGEGFPALEKIPCSHKVAIADIGEKEPVIRYGEAIGYATRAIRRGEWVHIHNLDAYDMM